MQRHMTFHSEYLAVFARTQHFLMRGDGPLAFDMRHYVAIMVSWRSGAGSKGVWRGIREDLNGDQGSGGVPEKRRACEWHTGGLGTRRDESQWVQGSSFQDHGATGERRPRKFKLSKHDPLTWGLQCPWGPAWGSLGSFSAVWPGRGLSREPRDPGR